MGFQRTCALYDGPARGRAGKIRRWVYAADLLVKRKLDCSAFRYLRPNAQRQADIFTLHSLERVAGTIPCGGIGTGHKRYGPANDNTGLLVVERSEEHTSELQSLMRISYAVFCLKKKINKKTNIHTNKQI